MFGSSLMLIIGVLIGIFFAALVLTVFFINRIHHIRDDAVAGVNSELLVIKEKCLLYESEISNLRTEKERLQTDLSSAQKAVAGLDSQILAYQERITELKSVAQSGDEKMRESNAVIKEYHGKIAELQMQLELERKQASEKLQLLGEARDQLKVEFQNLANRIFDENSRKFSEQNKLNLDLMLNPLRDQLGDFRKRVEDVYTSDTKERQTLFEQIRTLTDLNQQVGKEAENLARALKGENKTQGNWGEMILERALELSGLKKGSEFDTQVCFIDEDNKRQIPDVIVHLPDSRDIIVDSKVTLTAYESMVNSEDETSRENYLSTHLISVRSHIDQLSAKSYQSLSNIKSLDYVLMFMPVEAAFVAAIRKDPALFEYAYRKRIIIVSPSTLLVTLRTIQNMWQSENQNRNAQDIARKAADLYDKFAGFTDTLMEVKQAMSKASEKCDIAISQLSEGKGNIVRRIEEFRRMGVKSKKNLPDELLQRSELESDELDPLMNLTENN